MRFAFGKNWLSFLSVLDEHRIGEACRALRTSLAREDLKGCRALDIGSGRGLGKFDLVYAWGVLHHTGPMWPTLDRAQQRKNIDPNGN